MIKNFKCAVVGCDNSTVPSQPYCAEHKGRPFPEDKDIDKQIDALTARAPSPIERALNRQEGGSHYKNLAVQPAEFCHWNGLGKLEGDVVYYVTRWRSKNGIEDLRKARHTLDILIELETRVTEKT